MRGSPSTPEPSALALKGTISVPSGLENRTDGGSGCLPTRGYEDVDYGTQVTIKDASGKIIATGELGYGTKSGDRVPFNSGSAFPCAFPFTASVPPGSDFYQIEVSSRGAVTFTSDELTSKDVALTLGF